MGKNENKYSNLELVKFDVCSGQDLKCYVHRACLEKVSIQAKDYILNELVYSIKYIFKTNSVNLLAAADRS